MQHTETDFALDGTPMILLYSLDLLCLPKHRLLAINIPSHMYSKQHSVDSVKKWRTAPRQILDIPRAKEFIRYGSWLTFEAISFYNF